mgnify:CR=1 FL=1
MRNRRNRLSGPTALRLFVAFCMLLALAAGSGGRAEAAADPAGDPGDPLKQRRLLYERIGVPMGVPWHLLAAIDQYERTLTRALPKSRPVPKESLTGIYIAPDKWAGPLNPDPDDVHPSSIRFFGGIGLDGNADGRADRLDPADQLYTLAHHIVRYGTSPDDLGIGLWEYYRNTRAVQRVLQFNKLYAALGGLQAPGYAFPLPLTSTYTYRSTWGYSRSWGGYRIHEGTDLFAGYGVPVRSACYGIVELKGWNKYGGWRIGIRDLDNLYHYYAHLSGYAKALKPGDIVRPGQVIGWVGSSGYGKPGTQGKFPPHLHYGIYRDRGWVEWAFDPYPLLRQWERDESRAQRQRRS